MQHPLSRIDLNLLVAFDALMMEGGVTRAGRRLGITQAAMSNTLRRLREIFEDPLFVKKGHRMEPSSRALELHEHVTKALFHTRRLLHMKRFDPRQATSVFRIGMVDYSSAMLLPDLVGFLTREAPNVAVHVVDTGGYDELSMLESGLVDLVVSRFQWVPPRIFLHRLFQLEYVCLFRDGHPLVPGDVISMDALLSARYIHYFPRGMDSTVVDEMLANLGYRRQIVARLNTASVLPVVLSTTDLMTIVPSGMAACVAEQAGLRWARLPFDTIPLRVAIAWHPRTHQDPANIWLRDRVTHLLSTHEPLIPSGRQLSQQGIIAHHAMDEPRERRDG
jgi:DNA-binding transcriptional LysR family regulator